MIGLNGQFAPLVTAFTDDTSGLSEIRLARLMRRLANHHVKGFTICGEVGQFTTIGYSDRKLLAEIAIREAQGAPVLVHVTTLSTMSSLDLAQHASRHGARAGILMPPYYGTYTQEEIEAFFKTISQYADLPIIIVDPHQQIGPELAAKIPTFSRMYLADPNDHPESRPDSFRFEGASVSPSNLLMGLGLHKPLFEFMDAHGWNRVCKAALEELGVDCGPPRSPRQPLNIEDTRQLAVLLQVAKELQEAGELHAHAPHVAQNQEVAPTEEVPAWETPAETDSVIEHVPTADEESQA